jgi:hypothetical protein
MDLHSLNPFRRPKLRVVEHEPVKLCDDSDFMETFRAEASAKARLCTYEAAKARQDRKRRMHELLRLELGGKA